MRLSSEAAWSHRAEGACSCLLREVSCSDLVLCRESIRQSPDHLALWLLPSPGHPVLPEMSRHADGLCLTRSNSSACGTGCSVSSGSSDSGTSVGFSPSPVVSVSSGSGTSVGFSPSPVVSVSSGSGTSVGFSASPVVSVSFFPTSTYIA